MRLGPQAFVIFVLLAVGATIFTSGILASIAGVALIGLGSMFVTWISLPKSVRKFLTIPLIQVLEDIILWYVIWKVIQPDGIVAKGSVAMLHLGMRLGMIFEYYRTRRRGVFSLSPGGDR